jgi:DNA-directed RNA polymerase subunit M/transcription elongation factor TFIIS
MNNLNIVLLEMKFCPICEYYMPLDMGSEELSRICKVCGHREKEEPGLIMETIVQEKASEGYKVYMNEFTREDPTLPHTKLLKCPNTETCKTRTGNTESDTIYIKYDVPNLKFLYICNVCGIQWKSRS